MSPTRTALLLAQDDEREAPGPMASVPGLGARIALVLGTYREGSDGLVLDHPLWLAAMQALTPALGASRCEVLVRVPRSGWRRWWGHDEIRPAGSLDDLSAQLARAARTRAEAIADGTGAPGDNGPDAGNDDIDWEQLRWYRDDALVCMAQVEPWYAVGGDAPFHDSYTTRLYLDASRREAAVQAISLALQRLPDVRWDFKA